MTRMYSGSVRSTSRPGSSLVVSSFRLANLLESHPARINFLVNVSFDPIRFDRVGDDDPT